jgi:hypothetical protein
VISGAAAGEPNVKALVYLAAFAPEANEPVGPLTDKYPSHLGPALRPDAAGFLYIACDKVHDVFAADLPESAARVVRHAKPVHTSVFAATIDTPAWKTIPSWYLVSKEDHALNPTSSASMLSAWALRPVKSTPVTSRSSRIQLWLS